MKIMYIITVAASGQMPASEPEQYSTLAEAKQGVKDLINDTLNSQSDDETDYHYQRWEVLSRVTKRMIDHAKGLTVGVLHRPSSEHDLGLAVTIRYDENELSDYE